MQDNKTNRDKLYTFLTNKGVTGIGANRDEFETIFEDEEKQKKLYDFCVGKGYTGIGKDYDEFAGGFSVQQPANAYEGMKNLAADSVSAVAPIDTVLPTENRNQDIFAGREAMARYADSAQNLRKAEAAYNMNPTAENAEQLDSAAMDFSVMETSRLDAEKEKRTREELLAERKRLEDAKKEVELRLRTRRGEITSPSGVYQMGMAPVTGNQAAEITDPEMTKLYAAVNSYDNAIRSVDRKLSGEEPGFWEGVADATVRNPGFYTMGLTDMSDARGMLNIAQNGVKEKEDELLADALYSKNAEQQDEDFGFLYRAGNMFGHSVPFMVQTAVTGGFSGASRAGANLAGRLGKKAAEGTIKKKIINAMGTTIDDVIEAGLIANTAGAGGTWANIAERKAGKINIKDGDYVFENGESWLGALYKGEVSSILELYTEKLGGHFEGKLSLTKGLDKIGASRVSNVLLAAKNSDLYKGASTVMRQFGLNGYLPEVLEEEANLVLNSLLVGDNSLSELYNPKTQLDIFGGMLLTVGTMQAIPGTIATAGYVKNQYQMNRADSKAADVFGEEWGAIKEALDNATNEKVAGIVAENLREDEKHNKALLDYYKRMMIMRGYNIGTVKNETAPEIEEAYTDGFSQEPTGANALNAMTGYDMARQEVARALGLAEGDDVDVFLNGRTAEDIAKGDTDVENAVKNYQQQKARIEGIQEKFQQTREQQYEESDRSIQANDNNGMVYATQLKDEPVFITGGNVVLNEDGTIDVDNSSETLYVKFPDGHVEMTSPDKFTEVFTEDKTADLKAAKRAEIDAKWKAEFDTAEAQSVEQEKRDSGVVFDMTDAQGEHRIEILNEGEKMSDILLDGAQMEIPTEELSRWKQEAGIQSTENGVQSADAMADDTTDNVAPTGDNVAPVETAPVELPDVPDFFRLNGTNYEVASRNDDGSVDVMVNGKRETLPAGTDYSTLMPTDKKGDIAFADMPVERTHEYFVQRVTNDKKRAEMIDNNRKKAEAERKKFDKEPDAGLDPDKWEEVNRKWEEGKKAAQAKVDYWNEVAKREAEITRSETREAVENIKPDVMEETADEFIANQLAGIKITPESFKRETGLSNAEQAKLVGVISNNGVSVERAAEIILENYESELAGMGFTGDVQDVRDIIISVLSQGNPRSYAKKGREAREAENMDQQRADAEAWAKGAFDMKLEELYLYEETVLPRIVREYEGFDENEYYSNLAENNGYDTTRESESIGRGGELLQGEQPVPAGGTLFVGQRNEGGAVSDDVQGGSQNGVAQEEVPVNEPVGNSEQLSSSEIPNNQSVAEGNAPGNGGVPVNDVERVSEVVGGVEIKHLSLPSGDMSVEELSALQKENDKLLAESAKEFAEKNNVSEQEANIFVRTAINPDERLGERKSLQINKANTATQFLEEFENGFRNTIIVDGGYISEAYANGEKIQNSINLRTKDANMEAFLKRMMAENHQQKGIGGEPVQTEGDAPGNGGVQEITNDERAENGGEIQETFFLEETLDNGDKKITGMNSRGEVATVTIERDGKVVSVDSYDEGALFEHTEYDGNGKATSVTRYDKQGNVVGTQVYEDGKAKTPMQKLADQVLAAEAEVNTNPTEAQKEAGNYKKGHVKIGPFNISIEQPKGSVRSGVDKDGKKWEVEMQNTYGYFRGTEGVDGDHIDVFLSNDIDGWNGRQVFVVDQRNADGSFDEHKVMLGFNDINDAETAYMSNYEEGWQGLGAITGVSIEEFEKWISSSHRKTKAFAEYKNVKTDEGQSTSADKDLRRKLVDRILDRTEEKRRIPLRERARELEAQVGVKANIIESVDEVADPEARRRIVAGQNVAGWYSKGQVYLYMPNLQDRREIELTYVHEVVAHHGVKKLLGERFNEFLDGVWNMMSEADRARMLAYVGANENPTLQDMRAAADEYVAELAEKMDLNELERSTWDKIVGWFKELLENIGFENLTKEDIESMLKASYSNLKAESGKGKTGSTENDFRAKITFHGSGAKFDRFDHAFMGTGEGAQAFGWGTYVTEVEGIGRTYATTMRDKLISEKHKENAIINKLTKQTLENSNGNKEEVLDYLRGLLNESWSDKKRVKAQIKIIETGKFLPETKQKANLYTLEIPDDNGSNYLYWDKPINGEIQERIANGLQSIGFEIEPGMNHLAYSRDGKIAVLNINAKGKDLYAELSEALGGDKQASLFLSDMGFVGISYPAQATIGGRDDGARNYVIFNENDAQIKDRTMFSIKEVNDKFNSELQQQIDGTLPEGHIYELGMPSEILRATGIPELPIQLSSKKLKEKSTEYGHDYNLEEVKDLVNALNEPLAIFAYGDKTKAQNIVVEIQSNDKNFVVGLALRPKVGGRVLEINSIRNVFPKDNAEWLNWISQGKALYLDKERVQTLINQQRTNLADVDYLDLNSIANVINNFKNPTIESENSSENPQDAESGIRFRKVEDPAKIAELEAGEKMKVYRAMQVIDGKLYPPMSAKVDGKLREPIELGVWEEAEERPELADDKGYFKLDKGNKKSLKARYNPYIHTSTTPLNDQFSEAQERPNLVTVEVEIPVSELTSGYKAEKAKDAVGRLGWKAGVVQGKLSGTRTVILSRWDKPVRIVPDSEVADVIVEMFGDREIVMPSNVVTPSLRAELEKRGVPFVETNNQGKPVSAKPMTKEEARQMVRELVVPFAKELREEQERAQATEDSGTRFRIANENQEIFVSNAQRAVEGIQQNKATAEQWIAMLKKNGGLKAGEDAWLGLEEWLNEKQGAVTKQEILDYIGENKIQIEEVNYTQFGYGLIDEATRKLEAELKEIGWDAMVEKYPGFDELFEVYNGELLWSEERASVGEYEDFIIDDKIVDLDSQSNAINETREKYTTDGLERKREIALTVPTVEPYNESDEVHFGDAGNGRAVAWVRFGETTDSEGNRVLVIDEIQSKRHQDGREKGYLSNADKFLKDNGVEVVETDTHFEFYKNGEVDKRFAKGLFSSDIEKAKNLYVAGYEKTAVPSAPFEKNWHELAMKRMLRLAAEEGFDKVAWTTGEQQAERYNIGAVLKGLKAYKTSANEYYVIPYNNGAIGEFVKEYTEQELADTFGKELAQKIIANAENATEENPYEIEGEELRVGGEGMKGFYDRMLPSFVQKYTKKWGAKVGEVTMPGLRENNTMWSVDVTPEMQESVMQGQTMFRITDTDRQALEFKRQHKGSANIVAIDTDALVAELLAQGFTAEEIQEIRKKYKKGGRAFYDRKRNTIYLLGKDRSEKKNKEDFWHENTHKAIGDLDIPQEVMDEFYAMPSERFIDFFEKKAKEFYGPEEYAEELIAYFVEDVQSNGNYDNVTKALGTSAEGMERLKEIVEPIINYINHGRRVNEGTEGNNRTVVRETLYDNDVEESQERARREAEGAGTEETRFRTVEDVIEQQQENEVSLAKEAVTSLGEKLNTPVKIMDNLDSVPENRRKLKGWFDPKTGEVVVVMPNHVSTEDAVQTVLHEVVGHKGLRAVLGEDFDGFLDGVYKNASPKVKRGINDRFLNALKNGPALTVREATEEYIAGLAERDFEGYRDTWNAIRQWFRNFFRNFMNMEITDGELRYLLWKNYNRMKSGPVEAILDRAMEANTGTGKVMARTAETYSAVDAYNKSVKGFKNKVKEGWYDEMRSLKKAQEAIEKELGKELMDSENVYLYANHIPSINKNKKEVFDNKYLRPFTSLLKQLYGKEVNGKKLDEKSLERYTNAKHGIERNREMSVKNALTEVQDGKKVFNDNAYKSWAQERDEVRGKNLPWAEEQRELDKVAEKYGAKIRDYSGLTAIFDTEKKLRYKKIADAAYQYVADVEKALGDDVNKLWGLLKGMTDYSLNEAFESGMMSKSTYEHIKQMYRYYVPLRGFTEETAEDFFDYVEGDHSPLNAVVKTAYGRKSEADNIFATILNMANSAIVQGSKNRLKQRLLNLAMRSQTWLLNVDNAWYAKKGDTYEPVNYPDKANEYADFEERMKELEKNGEVVRHRPGLEIGRKVAQKWNETQHAVRVKRNGREYVVWVNGEPAMANAINGLLREEIGGAIKTVNQFRSKMVTQYSPTFVFTNLLRDVQSASIIYAVRRGTTMLKEFEKNVASNATDMMDLYLKHKRGTLDVNNPKERYFKEFLENGGETGYTEMISIEEYEKKLKELTTGLNIKNGTQRAFEAVGGAVDFANRCVENLCRFSAYQTSREAGISILKSIEDAKEVSVNFNRKGSGAMGQKYAKAGFMFLNPAVQSIAQRILLTKKYPKKMTAVWAGEFILGAAMPVLYSIISAALGDDDDEITGNYYNLSDYRRRSSLCLPLKDGVFHIPLSHESRVLFGLGELCTSVVMEHEKPEDAPIEALNTLAQSLPLNPVEGWMPGKNIIETMTYNFMPDAVKPVAEAVMNRDFAGNTVHNRTDFNEFMPEYMRGKRGTLGAYKKISKYLTSTDGYEKSFLNDTFGALFNPSVMEHLMEGYLGGLYTFGEKALKAGAWAFGNEEYAEFRNIPIASSFYTSLAKYEDTPKEERTRRDWENAFRFYKDEVKGYDDKEKTAKNGLKHGEVGADLVLEQMERNGEVLMVDIFNDGNDRLKELYGASDAARKNRDFKRVEDIDQQIYAEKRDIVSQMEQLADDPMIGYTFRRNKIGGPYGERETYGDVRDEKIIDDMQKELKPYKDGHNGTEAYGQSFKKHLDLYDDLKDVEDRISDLKRDMKNYPGEADERMNDIREMRAEAIKQINNYRKDE